jgi:hypothetical protein
MKSCVAFRATCIARESERKTEMFPILSRRKVWLHYLVAFVVWIALVAVTAVSASLAGQELGASILLFMFCFAWLVGLGIQFLLRTKERRRIRQCLNLPPAIFF